MSKLILQTWFLAMTFVLASSCEGPLFELEDPDDVGSIITITIADSSKALTADGVSQGFVEAAIPKDSKDELIAFSISKGKFLLTGTKSITIRAEEMQDETQDSLRAYAVFVSDTMPGTAFIAAKVNMYTEYAPVEFTPILVTKTN